MRLIDADKIRYRDMSGGSVPDGVWYTFLDDVEKIPTVKAIPLDKPFCKMVYGDYVCYNRNWLMKHLPMELDILQGKTIPVELIKSKIDAILDSYPDGNEETEILCKLLYEWEKENATEVND